MERENKLIETVSSLIKTFGVSSVLHELSLQVESESYALVLYDMSNKITS